LRNNPYAGIAAIGRTRVEESRRRDPQIAAYLVDAKTANLAVASGRCHHFDRRAVTDGQVATSSSARDLLNETLDFVIASAAVIVAHRLL
jgi:hypothetical protein